MAQQAWPNGALAQCQGPGQAAAGARRRAPWRHQGRTGGLLPGECLVIGEGVATGGAVWFAAQQGAGGAIEGDRPDPPAQAGFQACHQGDKAVAPAGGGPKGSRIGGLTLGHQVALAVEQGQPQAARAQIHP